MSACWVFHRWGKWSDIRSGVLTESGFTPKPAIVGYYVIQERRCGQCDKLQMREVKVRA